MHACQRRRGGHVRLNDAAYNGITDKLYPGMVLPACTVEKVYVLAGLYAQYAQKVVRFISAESEMQVRYLGRVDVVVRHK